MEGGGTRGGRGLVQRMGAARTSRMIGSVQVQKWQTGRYRFIFVYTVLQLLCRFVWFSGAVSHHRERFFSISNFQGSFFLHLSFFWRLCGSVRWMLILDGWDWWAQGTCFARGSEGRRRGVFNLTKAAVIWLLFASNFLFCPLDWIKRVRGCLLYEEWMEGLFGNFCIKSRHPHNSIITDWDNNKMLGVYLHVLQLLFHWLAG